MLAWTDTKADETELYQHKFQVVLIDDLAHAPLGEHVEIHNFYIARRHTPLNTPLFSYNYTFHTYT